MLLNPLLNYSKEARVNNGQMHVLWWPNICQWHKSATDLCRVSLPPRQWKAVYRRRLDKYRRDYTIIPTRPATLVERLGGNYCSSRTVDEPALYTLHSSTYLYRILTVVWSRSFEMCLKGHLPTILMNIIAVPSKLPIKGGNAISVYWIY